MLKDKRITITIVIPAYNESERISETINALKKQAQLMKSFYVKIYVIDDGSNDETYILAKKANADRIIRHKVNLGLGAAVRTGLKAAHDDMSDIAVKFDADLQHNPNDIPAMIEPILNDRADIVYGNRFHKISYKMPFVRKIGNKIFTGLMRWLTGWPLHDSQPGILAVNLSYLEVFNLPGDYNYTQQILLDAYLKGLRFEHVSVQFQKRETGKSFISMKYPFKVFPQILMVIIGIKPFKIFGPIGFIFLVLAGGVFAYQIGEWFLGISNKPVENVNLILGAMFFGLQTLFFGLLAELIVQTRK